MQQNTRYIRGILMRVASGLFSWSMAAGLLALPPIRRECSANPSGLLRPDCATISLNARIAWPYPDTLTPLSLRYAARGACSESAGYRDNRSTMMSATAPPLEPNLKSPVCAYNQSWTFVRFTQFFLPVRKRSGRRMPPAEPSAL